MGIILLSVILVIYLGVIINAILIGNYSIEEYLIVYGDSFVALLTSFSLFILLYQIKESNKETNTDRRLTVQLNYLTAKIHQLEIQMAFYSKLKGKILPSLEFHEDGTVDPRPEYFKQAISEGNIPFEYEYLAKNSLKEMLREYNTKHRIANIAEGTTARLVLIEMMKKISKQVDADIMEIQEEYNKAFNTLYKLMDE